MKLPVDVETLERVMLAIDLERQRYRSWLREARDLGDDHPDVLVLRGRLEAIESINIRVANMREQGRRLRRAGR